MMLTVSVYRDEELTDEQIGTIVDLVYRIWPRPGRTREQLAARLRVSHSELSDHLRYVIWHRKRAIGHARSFGRTILSDAGPIRVLALGGVCVAPEFRGQGWGIKLVERAFERIRNGMFQVALFQTEIPSFYERRGSRIVHNTFQNLQDPDNPTANPFEDPYQMIHPNTYPWPDGPIDINGPGY
jgi:GNAT superfamily N-acetyltransferase